MQPEVTVGISCYNIAPYVGRCIASVLAQTCTDIEVLVVDDGSTDDTGKRCDECAAGDPRVRVIHQENTGLGGTRNRVIEEARGGYIAFIDGDDYVEPDMIAVLLRAARETGAPLAFCRYVEEREDDKPRHMERGTKAQYRVLTRDELLQRYIEEDEEIPVRNAAWNKLYRADLIGAFRYPEHRFYEDIVVTTKVLAAADKAVFVDTPLYHYIIDRGDSIMNRGVNMRILTDQVPAYRDKRAFLQSIGRQDLADTHDYLMYKKLLVLYREKYRQPDGRRMRRALRGVIAEGGERFDEIFSCRIADPHQKLRMRLFLIHPALYRIFTAVNDGLVHRLRGIA